jgi:hypothetical protein
MSHMLIVGGFVDMAIKTKRNSRAPLASLLSLAMLLSLGIAASAQTMQPAPAPTPPNQPAAKPPAQTPNQPAPAPSRDDITSREVAEMDRFLDSHPEIAQQLRKDPSLIDNRRWVGDHPALHEYLQKHPGVADAFRDHPDAFMRDENRYERAEGDRDQDRDRDRDRDRNISRRDVTEMDRFLDRHPEVSEQLRKDPSLIDNRQWVANHPALQEYLKTHPQVAETFRAHPDAFMRDENRYDERTEGDRDRYGRTGERGDDERNRGELTNFGQFLGGHSSVASELSKDPSLATNKEYLSSHPELDEYLKAHPAMSQQLTENPQAVMSSNWVQQGSGFSAKPASPTAKPKSTPNQ